MKSSPFDKSGFDNSDNDLSDGVFHILLSDEPELSLNDKRYLSKYNIESLLFSFDKNCWLPSSRKILFSLFESISVPCFEISVLGFPFIVFLAPGLIIMSMVQQSFSHSVSSLMIAKIQGNIIDTLYAPLSAAEVTLAIILASVTRSIFILIISVLVF